ncbi:MAG: SDR family NAD(P)-dependent oxidoreductase [Candidatus Nanopelagicales bacterium]
MANHDVAIISGAASGIGRATAVQMAARGVKVVIGTYPGDPHDPMQTQSLVAAKGGQSVVHEVDVRDSGQVDAFAQRAIDEFGNLTIAVANAGILRNAALADLTDAAWDDMLQVDLTGVLRTFRSASKVMNSSGSMVAVSSIAGAVYGWPEHAHYTTAKAGLLGLVRSLAIELAPRGITVNSVVPGIIESPQSLDPVNSLGPEGLKMIAGSIPAGRVGTPDDVASLIDFLASSKASYISGQAIIVDGAYTVRLPV